MLIVAATDFSKGAPPISWRRSVPTCWPWGRTGRDVCGTYWQGNCAQGPAPFVLSRARGQTQPAEKRSSVSMGLSSMSTGTAGPAIA